MGALVFVATILAGAWLVPHAASFVVDHPTRALARMYANGDCRVPDYGDLGCRPLLQRGAELEPVCQPGFDDYWGACIDGLDTPLWVCCDGVGRCLTNKPRDGDPDVDNACLRDPPCHFEGPGLDWLDPGNRWKDEPLPGACVRTLRPDELERAVPLLALTPVFRADMVGLELGEAGSACLAGGQDVVLRSVRGTSQSVEILGDREFEHVEVRVTRAHCGAPELERGAVVARLPDVPKSAYVRLHVDERW